MKTRDRIVEAAIDLFNQHGTAEVTTNHIATAAGISPGNLYYHFRNKEDIIRAIFDQMDAAGMEEYRSLAAGGGMGTLEGLAAVLEMIQAFNRRYRFFKRELTSLVLADPLLHERFMGTHRAMLVTVRAALDRAIDDGLMVPIDPARRDLLAEQVWMVALFWLNYLEVGGEQVTDETPAPRHDRRPHPPRALPGQGHQVPFHMTLQATRRFAVRPGTRHRLHRLAPAANEGLESMSERGRSRGWGHKRFREERQATCTMMARVVVKSALQGRE